MIRTIKPDNRNVTFAELMRCMTEGKRYIAFPAGKFDEGTVLEIADLIEQPRKQVFELPDLPKSRYSAQPQFFEQTISVRQWKASHATTPLYSLLEYGDQLLSSTEKLRGPEEALFEC